MAAEELWSLDRAVAEAADAWINDPRDHEAYRRLVIAVLSRRQATQAPPAPLPDEDSAATAAGDQPTPRLGDELHGDARAVLDRLRAAAQRPRASRPDSDRLERLRAIRDRLHLDDAAAPSRRQADSAPPRPSPPAPGLR